jgi:translation initiation factor 1 (eIF-1/SUI1)
VTAALSPEVKEEIEMAKNTKQQQGKAVAAIRKPAGTRVGTTEDWRASGAKKFREKYACGTTIRDGR